MIRVTKELLEQGKSKAGGLNAKQLGWLKLKWPPEKDWQEKIIGTEITLNSAAKFLEYRKGGFKTDEKLPRKDAMYFVCEKNNKAMSHIVRPEDRHKSQDDIKKYGDVLCQQLFGIRAEGKLVGKKWTLRSTYSGKLCKNCVSMESQLIEINLNKQRQEYEKTGGISTPRYIDTGAK
jgi:hypothetical protein